MVLFWLVYFYSCYFFYKFFKRKKCQQLNLTTYNFITKQYTSNLSLGNLLVFLKNFILYQPKFLAYKYFYNSIKMYNERKNNNENNMYLFIPIILIFLILVLPFRFFIKWLTGFSYFSIKISSICATQMTDVLGFDWEVKTFYHDVIESYLQFITSYFFTGLFTDVSKKKIFYNYGGVDIYFNPPRPHPPSTEAMLKCANFIKRQECLEEAMRIGARDTKPALIIHNSIKGSEVNGPQKVFPGATFLNKDGSKIIYYESDCKYHISYKNGIEHPIIWQSSEGIAGNRHVNCYTASTAKNSDGSVFSRPIHYNEKNINSLEEDKLLVQKAIIASMFNPNWRITKEGLEKDQHINMFDQIQEMHDRKELNSTMSEQYEYFSFFLDENGIKLVNVGPKTNIQFFNEEVKYRESPEDHKIILIKDMIQNTTFKDGSISLPDTFENSSRIVRNSTNFFIDNNI